MTLVHGTFASKAPWTRQDSKMAAGLSAAGMACRPFTWSGGNSHHARIKAVSELVQHLREQQTLEASVPQAIVAHSHGGNIAVQAVTRLVGPLDQRIPIVTLATPFLFAGPQRVYPAVLTAATIAGFVLLFLVSVIGVVLAQNAVTPGGWLVYGSISFVPMLVIVVQIVGLVYWLSRHGRLWRSDVRERFLQQVQTPESSTDHLLVVRAADDEASTTLGFAQLSGRLSAMAVRLARPQVWVSIATVFALAGAALDVIGADSVSENLMNGFALATGSVCFLCLAIVSVPALVSLCFGLDGPTTSTFAFVSAEATPPGRHLVRQRPINPPDRGGLQHSSLYDDPEVIEWVVEYVTTTLDLEPD